MPAEVEGTWRRLTVGALARLRTEGLGSRPPVAGAPVQRRRASGRGACECRPGQRRRLPRGGHGASGRGDRGWRAVPRPVGRGVGTRLPDLEELPATASSRRGTFRPGGPARSPDGGVRRRRGGRSRPPPGGRLGRRPPVRTLSPGIGNRRTARPPAVGPGQPRTLRPRGRTPTRSVDPGSTPSSSHSFSFLSPSARRAVPSTPAVTAPWRPPFCRRPSCRTSSPGMSQRWPSSSSPLSDPPEKGPGGSLVFPGSPPVRSS